MVIIFGTGYISEILMLYKNELDINFFIDNNIDQIGSNRFLGYDVKSPEEIKNNDFDQIILASLKYAEEMRGQLIGLGVDKHKIINIEDLDFFSGEKSRDEIEKISSLLSDIKIRDIQDYQSLPFEDMLIEWESVITKMVLLSSDKKIYYPGECRVCNKNVPMKIDNSCSGSPFKVNFREGLRCPFCGMNNRQRAMAGLILEDVSEDSTVYLTEQVTPMYQCLKKYYKHLIGSEYLGTDMRGENEQGIRHEDLMDLSFDDETIDCIVSNDVFEHVADIDKALKETYRCLKKGGKLYATFPMYFEREHTVKRAQIVNGRTEYLMEPIYHGNPLSTEGSLVFYDFGMDFISMAEDAGFSDAYFIPFYSVRNGNIGIKSLFIFIAERN